MNEECVRLDFLEISNQYDTTATLLADMGLITFTKITKEKALFILPRALGDVSKSITL